MNHKCSHTQVPAVGTRLQADVKELVMCGLHLSVWIVLLNDFMR